MCLCHDADPGDLYRRELVAAGLLLPSGVPGIHATSAAFEAVIAQIEALWGRHTRRLQAEVMRFPPLLPRVTYQRVGHLHNFPDLMGSVHSFVGNEVDHARLIKRFEAGDDWSAELAPTALMLAPAACYPLYPLAAGRLAEGGRLVDLQSWVFRHEPSPDPARMQAFRMRELVRLGTPAEALAHRDRLLAAVPPLFAELGLEVQTVVASDPFFGRGGRVMKASQRDQHLKFELVTPIASADKPTAIMSFNCHLDHFGAEFGITTSDGACAHTSCVGIGLERTALALFKRHGLRSAQWPASVRTTLAAG